MKKYKNTKTKREKPWLLDIFIYLIIKFNYTNINLFLHKILI